MSQPIRSLISSASGPLSQEAFDYRKADDFYQKSLSGHTREAYRRVVREFFTVHRNAHPADITPRQVLAWRDSLVDKKQKPSTVTFKLSVVRSFYEYLRSTGVVMLNPAAANLVPPPALPEEPAGRALTPEEARLLLAGPDRSRADGARDYALLLTLAASQLTCRGGLLSEGRLDQVESWAMDREIQSEGRARAHTAPAGRSAAGNQAVFKAG